MDGFFEMAGTLIKISEITDFQIVQREFIYRPNYTEAARTVVNVLSGKKYQFAGMQPYAAIEDETHRLSSLSEYKTKTFKESIGKDLLMGAIETIGDKFNIKAIRAKKYACVNLAGRRFAIYLEDIPALVLRLDGKASDVHKNDELYPLLGEPIAPAINIVPALLISAKKQSIFYGNGIQIDDIGAAFERLKEAVSAYRDSKRQSIGAKFRLPLPKFPLLSGKKASPLALPDSTTECQLSDNHEKNTTDE